MAIRLPIKPAPAPVKPAPAPVKPAPRKPAAYGIVPPGVKAGAVAQVEEAKKAEALKAAAVAQAEEAKKAAALKAASAGPTTSTKPADYGYVPKTAGPKTVGLSNLGSAVSNAVKNVGDVVRSVTPAATKPATGLGGIGSGLGNSIRDVGNAVKGAASSLTPANTARNAIANTVRGAAGAVTSAVPRMKKGGKVKAKAKSSYSSGGTVSSASKRGDGIAQRGKTKCKMR